MSTKSGSYLSCRVVCDYPEVHSILLELREGMKTVQEWLGHATIGITADTYTHVSRKVKQRPAQLISEVFFRQK